MLIEDFIEFSNNWRWNSVGGNKKKYMIWFCQRILKFNLHFSYDHSLSCFWNNGWDESQTEKKFHMSVTNSNKDIYDSHIMIV